METHEPDKTDKTAPTDLEPEATKVLLKSASPESVLAAIFHSIMYQRGITISTMGSIVERFLDRYTVKGARTSPDRKNNLMKELKAASMTWAKFIKNLLLMDLYKIDIQIKAYGRNNVTTVTNHTLHLDEESLMKDELK